MKKLKEEIKEFAKKLGADLVGIASLDRYEGAPKQMDPRYINPEAKALIVLGLRIPRGALRGIEEGTYFLSYSSQAYGSINAYYMPFILYHLTRFIEDNGYEATPIPNDYYDWPAIEYHNGKIKENWSRPVSPEKPMPDIFIHFRIAAYLAGLGEIGYSKLLLTPEFGPRQRIGIVITEASLEPDPIIEPGSICDRCMLCVKNCPGNAISSEEKVKVVLAGKEVEWGKLDCKACDIAFRGGRPVKPEEDDGSLPDYIDGQMYGYKIKPGDITPFYKKPPNLYKTGQAICGGKGCIRACMIHLEKKGILKNKFEKPFRRAKEWYVEW